MSLYDPHRDVDIDPADAIVVVHRFLQKVKAWAEDREIPRRLDRVTDAKDPAEAAKLYAWLQYAAFTDHALGELEDGTLDGWFTPEP